jgi:cell division protein FtsL
MRVEPESEIVDQETDRSVAERDCCQPARPFGEDASGGENLGDTMATAVKVRTSKVRGVDQSRLRPSPKSYWRLAASVVLGIGLIGVVLVHVWLRLQVVQMGYVLSTTSKLQSQLEQENRELKIEFATLTSPDRLEAQARQRLGLGPPEKGQVIVLP